MPIYYTIDIFKLCLESPPIHTAFDHRRLLDIRTKRSSKPESAEEATNLLAIELFLLVTFSTHYLIAIDDTHPLASVETNTKSTATFQEQHAEKFVQLYQDLSTILDPTTLAGLRFEKPEAAHFEDQDLILYAFFTPHIVKYLLQVIPEFHLPETDHSREVQRLFSDYTTHRRLLQHYVTKDEFELPPFLHSFENLCRAISDGSLAEVIENIAPKPAAPKPAAPVPAAPLDENPRGDGVSESKRPAPPPVIESLASGDRLPPAGPPSPPRNARLRAPSLPERAADEPAPGE